MSYLHLAALLTICLSLILWRIALPGGRYADSTIGRYTIFLVFTLSFVLRIVLAGSFLGFGADMGCFSAWADRMVELGPGGFYSPDYFADYPPMYLYILWLLGAVKKMFHLTPFSIPHIILLKLPSILSDLGIGYLIYRTGKQHLGTNSGLALSCLYLFQPLVLLNTCLWGQIDSVFVLPLILVCLLLEKGRILPGCLLFGLGILVKPQMLIFTPILLVALWEYIFIPRFSTHRFLKSLSYGLLTLTGMALLSAPFGLVKVFGQYFNTLGSYPYASVNAYNFWTMLGLNWYGQDTLFLGLPCKTWGFLSIVLVTFFSILLGIVLHTKKGRFGLMGALLITIVFTFSVRMHERYLFPVFALLLIAYPGFAGDSLLQAAVVSGQDSPASGKPRGDGLRLGHALRLGYPLLFTLLALFHFYNLGHVLYFYDPSNYSSKAPVLRLTGLGITVCALYLSFLCLQLSLQKQGATPFDKKEDVRRFSLPPSNFDKKRSRVTSMDLILLLIITLFYSCFALYDLGDRKAPETMLEIPEDNGIVLQFPVNQVPISLSYYIAPYHHRSLTLQTRQDAGGQSWLSAPITLENVFTWQTIELPVTGQTLYLAAIDRDTRILELVFLDAAGEIVTPLNASQYPQLFDEASLYPSAFSFRNSMYFDEIYHGRTAYEYLHGYYSYENTHPPLGKILISLGIKIFGMNPFGWRIAGAFLGILMLPILYIFSKGLTCSTPASALVTWIFAFDFMHFTQTRIATIDVFIVFFIICMYGCLYWFYTEDFWRAPLWKLLLPLALGGISMGLGVASKWTGVYAGIGMGILFLVKLLYHYQQYRQAAATVSDTPGLSQTQREKILVFPKRALQIILSCLVFYILIPVGIYVLSYIPFRSGQEEGLLTRLLENQQTMFSYHSNLNATHYFSSPFYEWPLLIKPIWYYSGRLSETLREGITAFGNPLVWWIGIPAFLYMLYLFFKKKDSNALFLSVGYLAQYLPWFFITRITFIYHYFPSVVFVVLMIGYGISQAAKNLSKKKLLTILLIYGIAVFLMFLLFYPVLSGQPVALTFVKKFLRWFPEWFFVGN